MNADFYRGCTDAKVRLATTDALRKTEPTYKLGWNAPVTLAPPMVPANLPSCSTVPAGSPCIEPVPAPAPVQALAPAPVVPAAAQVPDTPEGPEQVTRQCAYWVNGRAYFDGTNFHYLGTQTGRYGFEKCLSDHGIVMTNAHHED
jgi:hypothetical protein